MFYWSNGSNIEIRYKCNSIIETEWPAGFSDAQNGQTPFGLAAEHLVVDADVCDGRPVGKWPHTAVEYVLQNLISSRQNVTW